MKGLAILAALALLVTVFAGQGAGLGRVLLSLNLPGLAEPLLRDPQWRGVALYRAGRMAEAAQAFAEAGDAYNQGTALARSGNYAAALESYDRVIHSGDPDARANFDLIAAYYAGLGIDPAVLGLFTKRTEGDSAESFVAEGQARAAGTGDEVNNTNTMMGLVQLESHEQRGVRRIFDDRFMLADERWLEQLSDVPGDYLGAHIRQDFKRRQEAGESPPAPEDPS